MNSEEFSLVEIPLSRGGALLGHFNLLTVEVPSIVKERSVDLPVWRRMVAELNDEIESENNRKNGRFMLCSPFITLTVLFLIFFPALFLALLLLVASHKLFWVLLYSSCGICLFAVHCLFFLSLFVILYGQLKGGLFEQRVKLVCDKKNKQ